MPTKPGRLQLVPKHGRQGAHTKTDGNSTCTSGRCCGASSPSRAAPHASAGLWPTQWPWAPAALVARLTLPALALRPRGCLQAQRPAPQELQRQGCALMDWAAAPLAGGDGAAGVAAPQRPGTPGPRWSPCRGLRLQLLCRPQCRLQRWRWTGRSLSCQGPAPPALPAVLAVRPTAHPAGPAHAAAAGGWTPRHSLQGRVASAARWPCRLPPCRLDQSPAPLPPPLLPRASRCRGGGTHSHALNDALLLVSEGTRLVQRGAAGNARSTCPAAAVLTRRSNPSTGSQAGWNVAQRGEAPPRPALPSAAHPGTTGSSTAHSPGSTATGRSVVLVGASTSSSRRTALSSRCRLEAATQACREGSAWEDGWAPFRLPAESRTWGRGRRGGHSVDGGRADKRAGRQ